MAKRVHPIYDRALVLKERLVGPLAARMLHDDAGSERVEQSRFRPLVEQRMGTDQHLRIA